MKHRRAKTLGQELYELHGRAKPHGELDGANTMPPNNVEHNIRNYGTDYTGHTSLPIPQGLPAEMDAAEAIHRRHHASI